MGKNLVITNGNKTTRKEFKYNYQRSEIKFNVEVGLVVLHRTIIYTDASPILPGSQLDGDVSQGPK